MSVQSWHFVRSIRRRSSTFVQDVEESSETRVVLGRPCHQCAVRNREPPEPGSWRRRQVCVPVMEARERRPFRWWIGKVHLGMPHLSGAHRGPTRPAEVTFARARWAVVMKAGRGGLERPPRKSCCPLRSRSLSVPSQIPTRSITVSLKPRVGRRAPSREIWHNRCLDHLHNACWKMKI